MPRITSLRFASLQSGNASCRLNIAARRSGVRNPYATEANDAPTHRAARRGSSPNNFSPVQATAYSNHSRIAGHYARACGGDASNRSLIVHCDWPPRLSFAFVRRDDPSWVCRGGHRVRALRETRLAARMLDSSRFARFVTIPAQTEHRGARHGRRGGHDLAVRKPRRHRLYPGRLNALRMDRPRHGRNRGLGYAPALGGSMVRKADPLLLGGGGRFLVASVGVGR